MEYAVKAETKEGDVIILRRGFPSRSGAEDHPVRLSLWKRVWVERVLEDVLRAWHVSPLTTQSLEPADFPETAEESAIGGLLRRGFGLLRDRFWPEGNFGRSVSRPRNPVSPMQIDLG